MTNAVPDNKYFDETDMIDNLATSVSMASITH